MVSLRELRLDEKLIFEHFGNAIGYHGSEKLRAMLKVIPTGAQHIEPATKMLAELLGVVVPVELVEANSTSSVPPLYLWCRSSQSSKPFPSSPPHKGIRWRCVSARSCTSINPQKANWYFAVVSGGL